MTQAKSPQFNIVILVTPHFNMAATMAFIDPFRAANYLNSEPFFKWTLVSETGGEIRASNGLSIATQALEDQDGTLPNLALVSTSWTAEMQQSQRLSVQLVLWSRQGVMIAALDTGAFILAKAGLLDGKRATVHYEHIDALIELFPKVEVREELFVFDGSCITCCGGAASGEFALHIIRDLKGPELTNSAARFLFQESVRGPEVSQNPPDHEPLGQIAPLVLRRAIALMETHLETPLTIPQICEEIDMSQRHLTRMFQRYVKKTPVLYYRDIRLDRARGLVTQTEMKLAEVAVASGFASQVHFSRAYKDKFGLPPSQDRIDGRVPFEYRAWPMHNPNKGKG